MDFFKNRCAVWGTEGVWWVDDSRIWSKCSGSIPPIPSLTEFPGVDATTIIQPWNPYKQHDSGSLDKRRRLIKLICKIRGEIYEEEKMTGTMNISVDDIKMIIKTINEINLDIKLEE